MQNAKTGLEDRLLRIGEMMDRLSFARETQDDGGIVPSGETNTPRGASQPTEATLSGNGNECQTSTSVLQDRGNQSLLTPGPSVPASKETPPAQEMSLKPLE